MPASLAGLRTVADLSPALLTALLSERFPGAVVEAAAVGSVHQGTSTHVHLDLTYAAAGSHPPPARVFIKTELTTVEDLPEDFTVALGEGGGGSSILLAEQRFYREIAPRVDVEMLDVYASVPVSGPAQFLVLAENVTDRGATFPDLVTPQSPERVAALLTTLASLHVRFWDAPELADGAALSWLETPLVGQFRDFLEGDGWAIIRGLLDEPYKRPLLAETGLDSDAVEAAFWASQQISGRGPLTLLHGDPHPGNAFHLPSGAVGLLDWQLVRRGSWIHDVGYAIVAALDPAVRAGVERDLLAGYLDDLRAAGVSPPAIDDAYDAYCCMPPWGFAMWAIAPGVMYSDELVAAVLHRFAVALTELDTVARLAARAPHLKGGIS